jgi:pimeloyl-ACP methyl ester carboxylesterase
VYSILETKAWHDAGLFVQSCDKTEGNANIARYLSTTFVARDMLSIVDALGEDGLLRFWGRSYSTVLGQTFAAMFPDRVGRILLDSVLRFDDYFSGQWLTANRDTEVALMNFFKECVTAGPAFCPPANFTGPGTTAQDLNNELSKVFKELMDNPVILPSSYQPAGQQWWQPGGTVYQDVKYWILALQYLSDQFFTLSVIIDLALKRDWSSYFLPPPAQNTTAATPDLPWNLGANAFHGIACSDGAFRADKPEDMYSLLQAQSVQGSCADAFAPQIWVCAQWPFEAAERFQGPFTNIKTKTLSSW